MDIIDKFSLNSFRSLADNQLKMIGHYARIIEDSYIRGEVPKTSTDKLRRHIELYIKFSRMSDTKMTRV